MIREKLYSDHYTPGGRGDDPNVLHGTCFKYILYIIRKIVMRTAVRRPLENVWDNKEKRV